jgi:hypothetical protein
MRLEIEALDVAWQVQRVGMGDDSVACGAAIAAFK